MKRLIFAAAVVGVLVGSTMGGMALADKGGNPNNGNSQLADLLEEVSDRIDDLDQNDSSILEEVGNIAARLDNSEWGLEEIKAEVAAIESKLDAVEAELGNVPRTEFFHDMGRYDTSNTQVWYDGYNGPQRHTHLTIIVVGLGPGEEVMLEIPLWSADYDDSIIHYERIYSDGLHTFEFESSGFTLWALSVDDFVWLSYAATVTYEP